MLHMKSHQVRHQLKAITNSRRSNSIGKYSHPIRAIIVYHPQIQTCLPSHLRPGKFVVIPLVFSTKKWKMGQKA